MMFAVFATQNMRRLWYAIALFRFNFRFVFKIVRRKTKLLFRFFPKHSHDGKHQQSTLDAVNMCFFSKYYIVSHFEFKYSRNVNDEQIFTY